MVREGKASFIFLTFKHIFESEKLTNQTEIFLFQLLISFNVTEQQLKELLRISLFDVQTFDPLPSPPQYPYFMVPLECLKGCPAHPSSIWSLNSPFFPSILSFLLSSLVCSTPHLFSSYSSSTLFSLCSSSSFLFSLPFPHFSLSPIPFVSFPPTLPLFSEAISLLFLSISFSLPSPLLFNPFLHFFPVSSFNFLFIVS